MTELRYENFDSETDDNENYEVEASSKPEESRFSGKCEELKSQISELAKLVKKDEEAVAAIKNKLSEIDAQDPEKALRLRKKIIVAIFIIVIIGTIGSVIGGPVLSYIDIGGLGLTICLLLSILSILLFLVVLPVVCVCFRKKNRRWFCKKGFGRKGQTVVCT